MSGYVPVGAFSAGAGTTPPPLHGPGGTISIPSWDTVIRIGHRPRLTREQWAAYYRGLRTGQRPDLPDELIWAANLYRAEREGRAKSAQPGWAQSYGDLMTNIDDIQDLLSTLATLGRLLLWAFPRILARGIPGLGWVILASDVLNVMNLLGTAAMPLYALFCSGPQAALLAGVPAVVLKNVLCREVWRQALRNPFSREAQLARRLASLGRLPSISNLIEVAQAMVTLFGVGLSLGSLYGMMMELIFSAGGAASGGTVTINPAPWQSGVGQGWVPLGQTAHASHGPLLSQAGHALAGAAALSSVADELPEELHFQTVTAALAAVPELVKFYHQGDHETLMGELLTRAWTAPTRVHPRVLEFHEAAGLEPPQAGHWPVAGAPRTLTGAEYIEAMTPQIAGATTEFLKARRSSARGMYYGAAVNQLNDYLWFLASGESTVLKYTLSTDTKLLTGMAIDGLLIPPNAPEERVWAFWTAARALVEARGGKLIEAADVLRLADEARCPLVKLLPPDSPPAAEWVPYLKAHGFTIEE